MAKRQLSQYSDQEVRDLYAKHGNVAAKAAAEVGCGPSTFKQRLALLNDSTYVTEKEKEQHLVFLMEELEARGIDPRQVNIKSAKIRTGKRAWETMHKDNQGVAHITPLKGDHRDVLIEISPKFEEGPKWPVIAPAPQAPIQYAPRPEKKQPKGVKRVFLWPDTQIGFYRDIQTDELRPFHDLAAIDVALQMLRDFQPETVIIQGDFLDLQSLSKYLQVAEFQLTLQPSINYAYKLLANIRSIVGPKCQISYLEGNHERRLSEFITRNALAAYGLRRGDAPEDWPVLSIPSLLNFSKLKIEYSAAYPGGQKWLTPKLVCTHQPPLRAMDRRATVIHGHTPQHKVDTKTVHYFHGSEEYSTVSVPGLMRTDDVADKTSLNSTSVPSNGARLNWQQGVGTVHIFADDFFDIAIHRIKNGRGSMFGKAYYAPTEAAA